LALTEPFYISLAGAASGRYPKTDKSSACMLPRLFRIYLYYYFCIYSSAF